MASASDAMPQSALRKAKKANELSFDKLEEAKNSFYGDNKVLNELDDELQQVGQDVMASFVVHGHPTMLHARPPIAAHQPFGDHGVGHQSEEPGRRRSRPEHRRNGSSAAWRRAQRTDSGGGVAGERCQGRCGPAEAQTRGVCIDALRRPCSSVRPLSNRFPPRQSPSPSPPVSLSDGPLTSNPPQHRQGLEKEG